MDLHSELTQKRQGLSDQIAVMDKRREGIIEQINAIDSLLSCMFTDNPSQHTTNRGNLTKTLLEIIANSGTITASNLRSKIKLQGFDPTQGTINSYLYTFRQGGLLNYKGRRGQRSYFLTKTGKDDLAERK